MIDGAMQLHARLAELHREIASVHQQLARETTGGEYYDQHNSPLGARLHLRLVRRGILTGFRNGRRVLVPRADVERYLDQHRVKPPAKAADRAQDESNRLRNMLAKVGGRVA